MGMSPLHAQQPPGIWSLLRLRLRAVPCHSHTSHHHHSRHCQRITICSAGTPNTYGHPHSSA